jgi:hypothetical protein
MRAAGRSFLARFHVVAGDNIMLHSVGTRRFITIPDECPRYRMPQAEWRRTAIVFGNVHAAR